MVNLNITVNKLTSESKLIADGGYQFQLDLALFCSILCPYSFNKSEIFLDGTNLNTRFLLVLDPGNWSSNMSPLLLIKQCFMSYDECIKQPNMLLEQTLFYQKSPIAPAGLTSYPARDDSVIKANPRGNQAFYPPVTPNAALATQLTNGTGALPVK